MTEKSVADKIVDQFLSDSATWDNIFAIREMNCFVIGMPPAVSARYNNVLSILPESEPCCGDLGERWFIKSKHNRSSVIITRYKHEYLIHLFDGKEYSLFLEGINCKKHALLHAYDLISFVIRSV